MVSRQTCSITSVPNNAIFQANGIKPVERRPAIQSDLVFHPDMTGDS